MPRGKPMSEETKQRLREGAAARRAAASAPPAASVEPPVGGLEWVGQVELDALPATLAPAPVQVQDEFASFFAKLAAAGGKQAEKDKALGELEHLLGKLNPKDYPDLVDDPVVGKFLDMLQERRDASTDVRPGEIYGEGLARTKRLWNWSDLKPERWPWPDKENDFVWVDYVPRENVPVTWNGITIYFFEDVPIRLPRVFVNVYMESRRGQALAKEHRDYLFQPMRAREAGVVPPISDPTILAGRDGNLSRMLRGKFAGGDFNPNSGLDMSGIPDAHRPGMETVGEGAPAEGAAA